MKTYSEALGLVSTMGRSMRDVEELVDRHDNIHREIGANPETVELLSTLLEEARSEGKNERHVIFSAFAIGVLIGIEMEKS